LNDLGRAFEAEDEIPSQPYLEPPSAISLNLAKFNVGLVWEGHHLTFRRSRFIEPDMLKQVASSLPDGIKFWSLQKHYLSERPSFLEDVSDLLTDWGATASVVNQMDLVLTIDTAMAHLAGSLGKDVMMLMIGLNTGSPFLKELRNNSKWYPSMRIFHDPGKFRRQLDLKLTSLA
jgi:hypothetical protein